MSKLTAVAYYAGIPPDNKNPEKPEILNNFISGVNAVGDVGIAHKLSTVLPCDVALIQGFVHEHGKNTPHLNLRKRAIDFQKKQGKRSLVVDSNLFLYADKNNSKKYLRYSFDGVFPTTGFYFDQNIDPTRWQKISQNLGIRLKPWKKHGDYILICLQRNGGWSMKGVDVIDWMNQTILKIKQYSSRPILIRTHPGDKKIKSTLKISHKNVQISANDNLLDDLNSSWATVVYNSSPAVASGIEGVPVFITDPVPQQSQAFEIANLDLSKIESPEYAERQQWVEKISMSHWNFEELKSGEAWKFFKQYV
jgi:hypothetical protein